MDKITLIDAYITQSKFFIRNGQLDSAYMYAVEANELALSIQEKNLVELSYETLYLVEKEKGNYKAALTYHEKYYTAHDSLYNDKVENAVAKERVTQNIRAEQQARETAETKAALLSSTNRLYGAIALGLLGLLLLGGYLFNQLRKTKNKLTTQNNTIISQNKQLKNLNATKDKFFGIIAHDIRSPIVALDGVGEQMEYYLKKGQKDKLGRLATRVDTTAKRLGGLLDNLLNWALLQQGVVPYHPEALAINEVVQSTLSMFQDNVQAKGIQLTTDINPELKVYADESALNTILRNLISNAIKFTNDGGTVSLTTEVNDNKVFININDTGTGISAEKLSKIFALEKKSEKGTAGEKGTGLGLNLVKELVDLNKGLVEVKSKLNQKSELII